MNTYPPTIYVADDNPVLLQGMQRALSIKGYIVETAGTGAALLERLSAAAEPPDLLLVDVMMPELGGFDVLARIRSNPRWAHLPVILITAASEEEVAASALESGAADFLAKPFRLADLITRIQGHVERLDGQQRREAGIPDGEASPTGPDELGRCVSRAAALDHLFEEFHLARRTNGGVAVVLLHLDHFEKLNDAYGAPAGDALLSAFGEWICSAGILQAGDCAGRYGDDEFLVVLREATLERAVRVAERARAHLASLSIRSAAGVVAASVSAGITAWPAAEVASVEQLLACADAALQHAKQAGRNCIRLARLNGRLTVQAP